MLAVFLTAAPVTAEFRVGFAQTDITPPAGPVDSDFPFLLARGATGREGLGSLAAFAMHTAVYGGPERIGRNRSRLTLPNLVEDARTIGRLWAIALRHPAHSPHRVGEVIAASWSRSRTTTAGESGPRNCRDSSRRTDDRISA